MKRTKTKLVSSIVTLLVCFAMLIGSTFAWFTDSASTGVNKIQAGNLDVEVKHESASVTTAESIGPSTKLFLDNSGKPMKWEPGAMSWETFKVSNVGSLAFKYVLQTNITGFNTVNGTDKSLKDVLKVKVLEGSDNILANPTRENVAGLGWDGSEPTLDSFVKGDGKLYPNGTEGKVSSEEFQVIVYWMPTANDNDWNVNNDKITLDSQPLFIDFGIKVLATQLEHEFDSFDNTYDKDATYLMYPSGVTTQTFEEATSVEYTNNLGETVTGYKPAVAAYVDSQGNVKYVGDISAAVKSGATEIYCKQNTTLRMRERLEDTNRSPDLTDNLTIYANGADFQYGEISMNMTSAGKASSITLKVYDAKNIKVWGATPNDGVTQTIVMENCTNIGQGRTQDNGILMFIIGTTGTVNATVKDCYVTANSSGIYMSTNGSLTVTDSTFVDCATGIKTSYKGAGTRTDRIENCVFTNCGCTAEMAGGTAYLKDDSAAYKYKKSDGATGTLSLTTKGNTITGTIGDKGDIQISNDVNLTGDTAFYNLSEFNALTEIPAGIKNVYLNIGDVSLQNGSVTIGNNDIADVYTSVTGDYTVGQELDDGRKIAQVWNAASDIYLANSNKPGITLYVSGSVKENTNAALNSSANYLNFKIPDASNIVFTKDFTVNGYFRMSPSFNDNQNLGGGVAAHKVKSVLFDHSTFNGIWIQNGSFLADSITLDGCAFNAYENTVSANDSNPLWFCNIRDCDITVQNCTFKASRPIKVVEQGVSGAEVKILNNTFDMSQANSANEEGKPKNDAIMFSTITNDSTLGNVEVKGNTVTGATSLLTFYNSSNITMANGATFTVSGNTLNGAKTSVEWKTATEYTPDFVAVN